MSRAIIHYVALHNDVAHTCAESDLRTYSEHVGYVPVLQYIISWQSAAVLKARIQTVEH